MDGQAGARRRRLRRDLPHDQHAQDAVAALAAMRYAQASGARDQQPRGQRGHSPTLAARYWGLSVLEYTDRADVWPVDPQGDLLPVLQCEHIEAVENLEAILDAVEDKPGVLLISERDLSVSMGERSLTTPAVEAAVQRAVEVCRRRGVPYGSPQVTAENVAQRLADGFRFLMPVALPFGARDTTTLALGGAERAGLSAERAGLSARRRGRAGRGGTGEGGRRRAGEGRPGGQGGGGHGGQRRDRRGICESLALAGADVLVGYFGDAGRAGGVAARLRDHGVRAAAQRCDVREHAPGAGALRRRHWRPSAGSTSWSTTRASPSPRRCWR